jgi:hypothetical protein
MIEFAITPRLGDPSWLEESWPALSPAGLPADLRNLTADDFIFRYFRVDAMLQINGVDFSIRTPGLPLIDFVLMLKQAAWEIDVVGHSTVETSQSQHAMTFVLINDRIRFSTNFSVSEVEVSRSEFDEFVDLATRRALDLLFTHHPELRQNQYLTSLAAAQRRH